MTEINFTKMHGAGNDFIVLLRDRSVLPEPLPVQSVCDRRTGIGADGLILLSQIQNSIFQMDFYNNDGSRAGMCGNGLRCAGLFASRISGCRKNIFRTDSGALTAEVLSDNGKSGTVRITIRQNQDFRDMGIVDGFRVFFGVAGVPHAIVPAEDVNAVDVAAAGRFLRNHAVFSPDGTNVDFVETKPDRNGLYRIRTYERGVEDETPACGTGIVSAGLVLRKFFKKEKKVRFLSRSNAELEVEFLQDCNILLNGENESVYLTGPAEESFCGTARL